MVVHTDSVDKDGADLVPRLRDHAAQRLRDGGDVVDVVRHVHEQLCKGGFRSPSALELAQQAGADLDADAYLDLAFTRIRADAAKHKADTSAWASAAPKRDDSPPQITPEEAARRRRGRRIANVVARHADELRPVLLDIIVDDVAALVGTYLASQGGHDDGN
jgi:hypothetical protein